MPGHRTPRRRPFPACSCLVGCSKLQLAPHDLESLSVSLEEKLNELPSSPGVYLHKDAAGKVIYVGKAKNLRSRVRSYFRAARPFDRKTDALVEQIASELAGRFHGIIVTGTEAIVVG